MSKTETRPGNEAGKSRAIVTTANTKRIPAPADTATAELLAKRESLKNIGRFAAYTAPAMVVLLNADLAEARRRGRGNGHNPGHGNGNGPNCDNPGLHLGFGNNRHSPC